MRSSCKCDDHLSSVANSLVLFFSWKGIPRIFIILSRRGRTFRERIFLSHSWRIFSIYPSRVTISKPLHISSLTRKVYQPIENDDGEENSNDLTQMSAYPSTSSKANIRGSPAWERRGSGVNKARKDIQIMEAVVNDGWLWTRRRHKNYNFPPLALRLHELCFPSSPSQLFAHSFRITW